MVLIETLWNVKTYQFNGEAPDKSINRNIVECKVCMSAQLEVVDAVLIETLWNVKTEDDAKAVEAASVLIETLWNVKVFRKKI